jgi:hypothetical protein
MVALAFLNAANNRQRHMELDGKPRHFYTMPFGARNIRDVTAGKLRNLYEGLYS